MFVQQINFSADDTDAVIALAGQWADDAINNGTVLRTGLTADLDQPGQYAWIVYFESAEAAQQNSERPETAEFATRFAELCTNGPEFRNLDVVAMWGS